jgi:fumarylpyruvate hydrolase
MAYLFPPAEPASLPIRGSAERLPLRRVYCVGRNYAEHAREMGGDPTREPPFFFQKNADNLFAGAEFPYPPASRDVHHEIELVAFLQRGGQDIPAEAALDHVFGYAIGLDMTRRDLQGEAKKAGRPWEAGKAFEFSAPCGDVVPASEIGHPSAGRIWLEVNGRTVQEGDLAQMIWPVAEAISHLSRLFRLAPGDALMTGTPAGVGPVQRGDALLGGIDGIGELRVRVV